MCVWLFRRWQRHVVLKRWWALSKWRYVKTCWFLHSLTVLSAWSWHSLTNKKGSTKKTNSHGKISTLLELPNICLSESRGVGNQRRRSPTVLPITDRHYLICCSSKMDHVMHGWCNKECIKSCINQFLRYLFNCPGNHFNYRTAVMSTWFIHHPYFENISVGPASMDLQSWPLVIGPEIGGRKQRTW